MNGQMEHALNPVEEALWLGLENQRGMQHMEARTAPEIHESTNPAMFKNAQVNLMLMCRISIYVQNKLGNLEFE